jgi:hypothetical protein
VASKLISALGTDFFWVDDVFVTGVAPARAKVELVDIGDYFTFRIEELKCCLRGGGCEFLVAVSTDEWYLEQEFLRLSLSTVTMHKGREDC